MLSWLKFGRKNPFDEFRDAVAKSFGFLVADLGFADAGETSSHRDIEVAFVLGAVRVVVGYEVGSEPWVYFDFMTADGRQSFGLHIVVEDRSGTQEPLARVAAASSVQAKVQALADLTREYGQPLLSGDPSSIQNLQRLRARFMREQNQQMFGTSTGETPRFTTRPTLPELFAEASNDDITCARAYQAVWDYGYSNAEIGAFLGMTIDDVQELLDRWERGG
jgi:hypothetical protein